MTLKNEITNFKYALCYYKKSIILITLLITVFISMFSFCDTWQDATGMTKSAIDKVDDIFAMDNVEAVAKKVTVTFGDDTFTIGNYTVNNLSVFTNMIDLIRAIALCFCFLSFFIGFLNIREMEIPIEKLVMRFGLWIVCMVLIFKGPDICYAIANFGSEIATKFANIATASNTSADTTEQINNMKQLIYDRCVPEEDHWYNPITEFCAALGVYIQLMIPSLAMWVVRGITTVVCFSRAFEIFILSMLSPLSFMDASELDHFGHGQGSRFLKNLAALALSGAIIIVIMSLCTQVSMTVINEALSGGWEGMVAGTANIVWIGVAQAGLVLKSQSIAKTIVGIG